MPKDLKLQTYRVSAPRQQSEGLRLGIVRYLPRGVQKKNYARDDYFDVWMPVLAPSKELLGAMKNRVTAGGDWNELWPLFKKRYEREMTSVTATRQTLVMLAHLAEVTPIAIGCYCADEKRCHRSLLLRLIRQAAAGKF